MKKKQECLLNALHAERVFRGPFHERHHDEDDTGDHDEVQRPVVMDRQEEVRDFRNAKCQSDHGQDDHRHENGTPDGDQRYPTMRFFSC